MTICAMPTELLDSQPIQRQFQDGLVMTQQGQGSMSHFDDVSKFYMGGEGLF